MLQTLEPVGLVAATGGYTLPAARCRSFCTRLPCSWQCNCHFSAVGSSRETQRRGFWFLLRTSGNPFSAELKVVGRATVNCHRSWKVWNPACRWSALGRFSFFQHEVGCCEATDPSCARAVGDWHVPSRRTTCAVLLLGRISTAKMNEKPKRINKNALKLFKKPLIHLLYIWLVVSTPLNNMSQLGWWHFRYIYNIYIHWGCHKWGYPIARWMVYFMENPMGEKWG